MKSKKVGVQIRRKTKANSGRTPRNLPDVHPDENVGRVPPVPDHLLPYPNAKEIWQDICRTLIRRGKLKFNHLPIVSQAVQYYSLTQCTNDQLQALGYIYYDKEGNIHPPLHQVRKSFTDAFIKCYADLTLDPKNEIYDCMIENSGRSTIEVGTYDEF